MFFFLLSQWQRLRLRPIEPRQDKDREVQVKVKTLRLHAE